MQGRPTSGRFRSLRLNCTLAFLFCLQGTLFSQNNDTVYRDTVTGQQRSDRFYDSVYHRLNRHKLGKLIYPIAFREPSQQASDPLRTIKSETPYNPYAGKVIRNITINTMAPFGTSVSDTAWDPGSKAVNSLNAAHVTTQNYVIRQELNFRKGERLNPHVMAENEKNIRDLPYIDNVRFVIRESPPGSDTVDVEVITKDVWSIGVYITTITSSKFRMALYDANFLGLGHRISVKLSMESERAPFFRIDGIDYTYRNISGTFINGHAAVSQDDKGNTNYNIGFSRDFFSITTRWAGAAIFSQSHSVVKKGEGITVKSTYQEELAWLGVSYPVRDARKQTRFILAGSLYNKYFMDRPYVTPQSDPFYLNTTYLLAAFSFSWNKYYTTSYVREFGKPENLPYGRVIQLNIGPAFTEFTQRTYTSLSFSAGNAIKKFGYCTGNLVVGGFIEGNHFEDGILTVGVNYLSRLYLTADRRFKFRGYFNARYGYGFNLSNTNNDLYDLNDLFGSVGLKTDSTLKGTHVLGIRAGTTLFAPWVLFGFKFALNTYAQIGLVSRSDDIWNKGMLYGAFGFGFVIKNDNLIFPPFYINLAFYPGNQPGVNPVQLEFTSIPKINIPDFIPGYPHVQTLGN